MRGPGTGGRRTAGEDSGSRGFTLVGVLVALVLTSLVLASAYAMILSGSRLYTHQREARSASEALRAASSVLVGELLPLAPDEGDLYAIEPDSIVVRSMYASGVVCSRESGDRFGLQEVSGTFGKGDADTVTVYVRDSTAYITSKIVDAWNGAAEAQAQTPVCFWADSSTSVPRPQAAVRLTGGGGVADIEVGADLHAFRRVVFLLVQDDGRWWLGRRVAAGTEEVLAGPLLSPGEGGLAFTYLDEDGAVTTDPAEVRRVEVTLRSESLGRSRFLSGSSTVRDSLTLGVHLRNGGS